jgi:hypothetical protein
MKFFQNKAEIAVPTNSKSRPTASVPWTGFGAAIFALF